MNPWFMISMGVVKAFQEQKTASYTQFSADLGHNLMSGIHSPGSTAQWLLG